MIRDSIAAALSLLAGAALRLAGRLSDRVALPSPPLADGLGGMTEDEVCEWLDAEPEVEPEPDVIAIPAEILTVSGALLIASEGMAEVPIGMRLARAWYGRRPLVGGARCAS